MNLQPRTQLLNLSSAAIRRTIVWPTTACIGSTTTYFADPSDSDAEDAE